MKNIKQILRRVELGLFAVLLIVVNLPLWHGEFRRSLMFVPAAVHGGEWWRLFTHPLVHVTWYHLLLDGAAFFLLFGSLREPSSVRRLGFVAAGIAGSLLAALAFAPQTGQIGLCGLSGVAHGLMAVSALELIHDRQPIGWVYLAIVVGKSVCEAAVGKVAFAFLYFGLMGQPVAVCHLGGVLGGVGFWSAAASCRSLSKVVDAAVPAPGLRRMVR